MKQTRSVTVRQQVVYDCLCDFIATHEYPPTVRELCDLVGCASPSTVQAHLEQLQAAGLISRDPTKARALKVLR